MRTKIPYAPSFSEATLSVRNESCRLNYGLAVIRGIRGEGSDKNDSHEIHYGNGCLLWRSVLPYSAVVPGWCLHVTVKTSPTICIRSQIRIRSSHLREPLWLNLIGSPWMIVNYPWCIYESLHKNVPIGSHSDFGRRLQVFLDCIWLILSLLPWCYNGWICVEYS